MDCHSEVHRLQRLVERCAVVVGVVRHGHGHGTTEQSDEQHPSVRSVKQERAGPKPHDHRRIRAEDAEAAGRDRLEQPRGHRARRIEAARDDNPDPLRESSKQRGRHLCQIETAEKAQIVDRCLGTPGAAAGIVDLGALPRRTAEAMVQQMPGLQ
jgi:hypothetical protein